MDRVEIDTESTAREGIQHAHQRTRRLRRWNRVLLVLFVVASVIAAVFVSWALVERGRVAQQGTELAQQIDNLCKQGRVPVSRQYLCGQADKVIDNGKKASITPDVALSRTQVQNAVDAFCLVNGCTRAPSASQVAQAVALYCDDRGKCKGKPGKKGQVGPDGPPGTPPTTEQIAQSVADYCADGKCVGPKGEPGDPGKDGKDGRGIESVECSSLDTETFVIHYSDGTSETVSCATGLPTGELSP